MTYLNLGSHVLLSLRISTVKWCEGSCGQNIVSAQLAQKLRKIFSTTLVLYSYCIKSIEIWQKLSHLAFR